MSRIGSADHCCADRRRAGCLLDAPFGVPRHVAIIMDGNGRWAAARGLPRGEGHRRGVEALRRTVRAAGELGIAYLTIFSFCVGELARPAAGDRRPHGPAAPLHPQRSRRSAPQQRARARDRRARRILSATFAGCSKEAEELTRDNTGLTLVVAFNYGARQEIVRAARRIARGSRRRRARRPPRSTAECSRAISTPPDIPDPDLIIRTSGEQRLSNFLLWQAAYSEFVFVPVLLAGFRPARRSRAPSPNITGANAASAGSPRAAGS